MSTSTPWIRWCCCAPTSSDGFSPTSSNWNGKRSSSSCVSSRRRARQQSHQNRRTKPNPRNSHDERLYFARRLRCNGHQTHDFETFDDEEEEMLENFLEPPRRDTGIPSEWDINIDIDEGTRSIIAIFRRRFSFLPQKGRRRLQKSSEYAS